MDPEKQRQKALERFKAFYESSNYQQGGAVVTRHQAKNQEPTVTVPLSKTPIITTKRKLQDVIQGSKKQRVLSPVATSSRTFEENTYPPTAGEDDGLMDYEKDDGSETVLFDTSTTVYEDKNLQVNVIKEMFKRQKIFNIEDHSYVM